MCTTLSFPFEREADPGSRCGGSEMLLLPAISFRVGAQRDQGGNSVPVLSYIMLMYLVLTCRASSAFEETVGGCRLVSRVFKVREEFEIEGGWRC